MKWTEKFVPDAETCIALFTMGFPQKETTFVWVDSGLLGIDSIPKYNLARRVDISEMGILAGVFAAYTAEEFQTVLPENFLPVRMRDGTWMIVDIHGSTIKQERSIEKIQTQAIILARVNGSSARTAAQAWAQAAIFLIQTGAVQAGRI